MENSEAAAPIFKQSFKAILGCMEQGNVYPISHPMFVLHYWKKPSSWIDASKANGSKFAAKWIQLI
jgi:hypothetical protein